MSALEPALPRSAYLDDDVWALERERIFAERVDARRPRRPMHPRPATGSSARSRRVGTRGPRRRRARCARSTTSAATAARSSRRPTGPQSGARPACCAARTTRGPTGSTVGFGARPSSTTTDLDLRLARAARRRARRNGAASCSCISSPRGAAPLAEQLGPIPERIARYPLATLRRAARLDLRRRRELEGARRELQRVLPLRHAAPGAVRHRSRVPCAAAARHSTGSAASPSATARGRSPRPARAHGQPFPGLDADERERHKGELVYPNLLLSLVRRPCRRVHDRPARPGRDHGRVRLPVRPRRDATARRSTRPTRCRSGTS